MRIEKQITVEAPPEKVWEWIGHPQDYPRWLAGMTRFDPESEPESESDGDEVRVGSRYAMRMHVGSADVGGLIEVVECDPCKELAWTSITGIDQRGRWRLREVESETRVGAPRTLLLLGAIFFLALAAHELFAGRLAITGDRRAA